MKKTTIIYQSVLAGVFLILIALPLIKVPVSVSARGSIRPSQENTKVTSLVGGRIVQTNLHSNNQAVKKGDTLLVVTSELLHSKKSHQQNLQADYQAQLNDLAHLVNHKPELLRTALYRQEWSVLEEKMRELQTQLTLAQRELERNTTLHREGVVSLAEYEKSLFQEEQLQGQLNGMREQQQASWHGRKREIEQQLISLSSEVRAMEIDQENYIIIAPIDGRITNLQGLQAGNYVVQGQHVADISAEESLLAECLVPGSSIGFVQPGQKVKFQIDTYNYNQWGMLEGTVQDVDYNLVSHEQTGEAFFRVRCVLDSYQLQLKNGYVAQVGKGNTYTARFYLLERTLWQLLFDKVDDWFNPALAKG